jgi:hypothetical protein
MEKPNLRKHLWEFKHTLRYKGFRAMLWKALRTYLTPLGQLGLESLCQKDLTQPLGVVRAKADITVCIATEADIDQLVTLVAGLWGPTGGRGPYTELGIRGTILDRFRRGQKCFVGKIGREIVHYNWIGFDWEETIAGTGRFIRLRDDEAVCHDGLTVEAWRGRAIHTAVHNQMLLFLKETGYRRAYTVVGTLDPASQKTHHRLDWQFSGTMLCFIPHGAGKARIWRIRGTLDPFVYRKKPVH